MNSRFTIALIAGTNLLCLLGCTSHQQSLILQPVGPRPLPTGSNGESGSLVVFSAPDANAHFYGVSGHVYYSDYNLLSDTGALLQTVHNNIAVAGPATVTLPTGSYRVVAKANGYGTVTVPVVIAPRRTTTVHLEGGYTWRANSILASGTPVRLPDGEIVGWSPNPGTNSNH